MPRLRSSAIAAAEYEHPFAIIWIQFTTGPNWFPYPGAPYTLYLGLLKAKSPGKFFNAHIKRFSLNHKASSKPGPRRHRRSA